MTEFYNFVKSVVENKWSKTADLDEKYAIIKRAVELMECDCHCHTDDCQDDTRLLHCQDCKGGQN